MLPDSLEFHIANVSTPVVVLKAVRHGGLAIARSLGRLGVPVHNLDHTRRPAFASKYSIGNFIYEIDKGATQCVDALLEVSRKLGRRALLIPTTDEVAMTVAAHADQLRSSYIFPAQPPGLVHSLCSKREMYFLAKRCGVPTPHTAFPRDRTDVLQYLETARFPVMLKGIYGKRLKQRAGKPMFIVHDARELLRKYDSVEDPSAPNLMLQEYIPGGDDSVWMFNGYFNANGDCLIGFTGKKIRQCPVYTGPTCLGICLRNDIVDQTTRAFMRRIGYRGVLDIGYRYDARDGEFKVLDVNPRIGATFRLFLGQRGLDVARALYLDMTDQPVPIDEQREGRKWIVEDCDLISSFRYFKDGKLRPGHWLKSFTGIEETALFAVDDPLPALSMVLSDTREALQRAIGRVRPTLGRTSRETTATPSNALPDRLA